MGPSKLRLTLQSSRLAVSAACSVLILHLTTKVAALGVSGVVPRDPWAFWAIMGEPLRVPGIHKWPQRVTRALDSSRFVSTAVMSCLIVARISSTCCSSRATRFAAVATLETNGEPCQGGADPWLAEGVLV
eukprot:15477678-Alexandrium_andersonii.AAC.1